MKLDKDLMRFHAKANTVALSLGGRIDSSDDGESFVSELYAEYKAGDLADPVAWLKGRLRSSFQSVGQSPKWIEREPSWPFFAGKPMVFISQTSLPDCVVCRDFLTTGETVYLFGARRPVDAGYEMVYTTVSQHAEFA